MGSGDRRSGSCAVRRDARCAAGGRSPWRRWCRAGVWSRQGSGPRGRLRSAEPGPFPTRHHFVPLNGHLTHESARVNTETPEIRQGARAARGGQSRDPRRGGWTAAGAATEGVRRRVSAAGRRRAQSARGRRNLDSLPDAQGLALEALVHRIDARKRHTEVVGDAREVVAAADGVDPAVRPVRARSQQSQATLGCGAGVDAWDARRWPRRRFRRGGRPWRRTRRRSWRRRGSRCRRDARRGRRSGRPRLSRRLGGGRSRGRT
jgi:hypothetical protein